MKNPGDKAIDRSIQEPEAFWKQVEQLVPGLEEIYFAGGEPLIMEEHYHLLEMLHRHKKFDLTLKYNTNLSGLKFKNWEVMEMWKPFKKIIVAASLDGSGARGEYQRKNQQWSKVVEIRKQLMELSDRIQFLISPTLSLFNVFHLPDFNREWVELGYIQPFDLIPSLLTRPPVYDIAILPAALKKEAKQKILDYLDWLKAQPAEDPQQKQFVLAQWQGAVNRLEGEGNPKLLEKLKEQTQKLDELRGESFVETFPELATLF